MAAGHFPLLALNAGEIGADSIARVDLAKMRYAAEQQLNLLPSVLGPAQFRPGLAYKATAIGDCRVVPFVFDADTKAELELSNIALRILIDGVILTRPAVTAAVTNGNFGSNVTSWTDSDEAGAVSAWATGGFMSLVGTGSNEAIREQQVTVNEPGVEHALRIIIERGPVTLRVGSASQTDNYIAETSLRTGYHSLAFTPSGDFFITLSSASRAIRLVDSINLEAAVAVSLITPWSMANARKTRFYQSLDVMFCACNGIIQKRIERRSQRSWSIVDYAVDDGPFRGLNLGGVTITPSATVGNVTLTASKRLFKTLHVGSIWRMTHSGQKQIAVLTGEDQFTDPVRVTGIGTAARTYTIAITGAFVGTITVQRAFAEPTSWIDTAATYAAAATDTLNDPSDNQIVFVRIGFKTGDYTSGTPTVTINYQGGNQSGIARLTAVASSVSASAEVIKALGNTSATNDWEEGEWSVYRGFPSAVEFHDGRLWWGWRDRVYGSVSDAYESYDDTVIGDSGPIIRSATRGGADSIYWLLSSQRLLGGTAQQEFSIRSSSFDEPLTPTQFTARPPSTRGSANVQGVAVDSHALFVHRNLARLFRLAFSVEAGDYAPSDLTRLKPEMCSAGIIEMAVQRQPDTRVWCILADGTCAVLTYEPEDEVMAWTPFTTDGLIKSVCVLPAATEDEVWFVIRRTISGSPVYYHEKMALQSEAKGGTLNKTMDSHIVYSGSAVTTIGGMSHLIGKQVVVWGNSGPLVTADAPKTVNGSGQITGLSVAVTDAVIGLPYDGKFKSAKLAYGAEGGTALTYPKRVDHLGLLMNNVAWKGIRIGRDFSNLRGLHTQYKGRTLTATETLASYDFDGSPFGGAWDTDSRVCFQITSPYCATFLGIVIGMETNEQRVTGNAQN